MGIFGYIYHSCKNSVVRDLIFTPATYSIWAPNSFLFGDILLKHYHSGEARLEASFSLPFMNFTVCISTFNWKEKRISILTVLYFSIYVLEKKICKERSFYLQWYMRHYCNAPSTSSYLWLSFLPLGTTISDYFWISRFISLPELLIVMFSFIVQSVSNYHISVISLKTP